MKIGSWIALRAVVLVLGRGRADAAAETAAPAAAPRETSPGRAARETTTKPGRPPLAPEVLARLVQLLLGTDQDAVGEAIAALGQSAAPNAAEPLIELLSVGTRPAMVIAGVEVLGKLRDPRSVDVLLLYAGNRNADVRRQVATALGEIADPRGVPTLVERLGDGVPEVRAAAAQALVARHERSASPRLLALFKCNDAGAAVPLGTLAPPAMVPAILELRGAVDDANLASALGELVKRAETPEAVRTDIVKTLARIPGAASTTALLEYIGALSPTDKRGSKAEAQRAINERSKRR